VVAEKIKEAINTPEFLACPIYKPVNDAVAAIAAVRDNAIVMLRDITKKEAEFEEWRKKSEEVDAMSKERDEALDVAHKAVLESEELAQTVQEKESELKTAQDKLEELQQGNKELQQDNKELQEANSKLREELEKKDQEVLDKASEAVEKYKESQELRDLMDSRAALWAELTVRELRKVVIQNFGKRFKLSKEDFEFIRASEIADIVEKKVEQRMAKAASQEESSTPAGSSRAASASDKLPQSPK
jgi:vacuolar-type H+-ATPase subunit I/STV1